MTALELRYRRLLGVYPPEHRSAYEEEMVGVLMSSARPDQRFPSPGDVADLLGAGLRARLGGTRRMLAGRAWRDAAAVVGLLTALLLTAAAGRRLGMGLRVAAMYDDPMRAYGVDGLLLLDVAVRTCGWLAVVVALVLRARRTAVGAAVLAVLIEVAAIAFWAPVEEFRVMRMSWVPVLGLLVVACLALAVRGRPVAEVLGRQALPLCVGIALLTATASAFAGPTSAWPFAEGSFGGVLVQPIVAVAAVAPLLVLLRVGKRVRRRVLVLAAPVLAVPVAQQAVWGALDPSFAPALTPAMLTVQYSLLLCVPAAAFAMALALLQAREHRDPTAG